MCNSGMMHSSIAQAHPSCESETWGKRQGGVWHSQPWAAHQPVPRRLSTPEIRLGCRKAQELGVGMCLPQQQGLSVGTEKFLRSVPKVGRGQVRALFALAGGHALLFAGSWCPCVTQRALRQQTLPGLKALKAGDLEIAVLQDRQLTLFHLLSFQLR